MNEELFTRYFISDLPSVNLLIRSLDFAGGDESFHNILLDQLKLRHVDVRAEIRDNKEKLTDLSFKTYLNSLLIELRSSSEFYRASKLSDSLDHNQRITINELSVFNSKILGHLIEYYNMIFPELFTNDSTHSEQEGLVIFTSDTYFPPFEKYISKYIVDDYIDISYLFQRMRKQQIIHRISHLEFA